MPRVIVQALEGRSIDQKRDLVGQITDAVSRCYDVEKEAVTVVLDEMALHHWAKGGILESDRRANQVKDKTKQR